ncbi:hypothetical protein TNCV_179581 [Trichonephila clavipes]|nr:hypothetical protein TNCV_179581 [Trichonephila clavipes]
MRDITKIQICLATHDRKRLYAVLGGGVHKSISRNRPELPQLLNYHRPQRITESITNTKLVDIRLIFVLVEVNARTAERLYRQRRGLAARWLFRVSQCREGTIHLETSMPSPGLKPRPCGFTVRVTNHYTGWTSDVSLKEAKAKVGKLIYDKVPSGKGRSRTKPGLALIMSRTSCATAKQSFSVPPAEAWEQISSHFAQYHAKWREERISTDL